MSNEELGKAKAEFAKSEFGGLRKTCRRGGACPSRPGITANLAGRASPAPTTSLSLNNNFPPDPCPSLLIVYNSATTVQCPESKKGCIAENCNAPFLLRFETRKCSISPACFPAGHRSPSFGATPGSPRLRHTRNKASGFFLWRAPRDPVPRLGR